MITEEQRRALFALREALHLCDDAYLMLALNDDEPGMTIETIQPFPVTLDNVQTYLSFSDIDFILSEHPES